MRVCARTRSHTHTPHREKRGHTSVSWYTQEHWESRSTLSRQVTKASKNSMSLDEHMAIQPRKERERQFLAQQTAQKLEGLGGAGASVWNTVCMMVVGIESRPDPSGAALDFVLGRGCR